ncbi:hypothetical protein L6452_03010 [Arctium lappa]|uniref:Uncharacterized protein n=1 Tax=Arctium lappa TaxID=4217 RepID=A0ACB9FL21_ARCLA|nr:hypothetical protein L6452_03010 [Arctium lappa]
MTPTKRVKLLMKVGMVPEKLLLANLTLTRLGRGEKESGQKRDCFRCKGFGGQHSPSQIKLQFDLGYKELDDGLASYLASSQSSGSGPCDSIYF